jgi:glucose/arabinose dehydrogenase
MEHSFLRAITLTLPLALPLAIGIALSGCAETATISIKQGSGTNPTLPAPVNNLIPTVNIAPAVGWPATAKPTAAAGTQVAAFARQLQHPRWIYVLPNGDVLVAESNAPAKTDSNQGLKAWITGLVMKKAGAGVASANRITLLRDSNGDGVADVRTVFLQGLNSPFGMALVGTTLYVANTDAVLHYNYLPGDTQITAAGNKLLDLPAGAINHHWTKNLIASLDGKTLYITVGSNSNIAERGMAAEAGRAAIWQVDVTSGEHRLFATGLRNPNGLAWQPTTGELWTVVNERDELGSDLVPDYLTSVKQGGFYGWPYSYYGQHLDTRVTPQRADLVVKALVPDYALGAHVAPLGLAYSANNNLPMRFNNGMFIGQHGSWNRRPHSGYNVVFVPFVDGKAQGDSLEVLTGFLSSGGKAYGRPVGVALDNTGALLVADDVGNIIWRLSGANTNAVPLNNTQ